MNNLATSVTSLDEDRQTLMGIFCWNCRGNGNEATIRELCEFAVKFAPKVLCIFETQITKVRVEKLAGSLGYDNSYTFDSSDRSGGLAMFWNNEIKFSRLL